MKRRQVVKQEMQQEEEEEEPKKQPQQPKQNGMQEDSTPSRDQQHQQQQHHNCNSVASIEEDGGVTLAQLSKPKPISPSLSTGKARKKDMVLKIKMRKEGSEVNHVLSDQSQKNLSKKVKSGDGSSVPAETKSAAMIRAEELRSNLDPMFPSLIKPLGLPGVFCRANMPGKDTTVILEDECGKQFDVKYIAHKSGLSAGWRIFCIGHNLLEGDVLIFQLIEPCKFKVYIVKADNLGEVDGALGLLNLDAPAKRIEEDHAEDAIRTEKQTTRPAKRKRAKSLPAAVARKRKKNSQQRPSIPRPTSQAEQYENDSEGVASEVLEGLKLPVPNVRFDMGKTSEDFHVTIDGIVLDSEFPEHIHNRYYELCSSQASFLHEKLIKGINHKLIIGAICETVTIANVLRACKITSSQDEFENWDRRLKALEIMGMSVAFLCVRLKRLMSLALGSGASPETKKYIEAKRRRASAEVEIKNLQDRLLELKEASDKIGAEMEGLKPEVENYETKFLEEVNAPW